MRFNEVADVFASCSRKPVTGEVTLILGVCACDVTDLSLHVIPGVFSAHVFSYCVRQERATTCGNRQGCFHSADRRWKLKITTLDLTIKGYFLRMNVTQKCLLIVWPSLVRRKLNLHRTSVGAAC